MCGLEKLWVVLAQWSEHWQLKPGVIPGIAARVVCFVFVFHNSSLLSSWVLSECFCQLNYCFRRWGGGGVGSYIIIVIIEIEASTYFTFVYQPQFTVFRIITQSSVVVNTSSL